MSNKANHKELQPAEAGKGMTLQEIRMRMAVTDMQIRLEKDRLMTAIHPATSPGQNAILTSIGRFENFMAYASLFITAYRMAKKGINLVKELKK